MKVGDERGFMLLEVLVAAVLTIGVILAVTTAVLATSTRRRSPRNAFE